MSSISIDKLNIPFGHKSDKVPKSSKQICDSSSSSVVSRRSSNSTRQIGDDLIDLVNGIEDP